VGAKGEMRMGYKMNLSSKQKTGGAFFIYDSIRANIFFESLEDLMNVFMNLCKDHKSDLLFVKNNLMGPITNCNV
jgi:hypothetical protein